MLIKSKEERTFTMTIFIVIAVVILVGLLILCIVSYNELVTLRQRVKNGFSQIDVQLQKRFDLIPNLVETVKGYSAHEAETLENVTKLRSAWIGAKSMEEKAKIDTAISSSLRSIYAVSESYPELKANSNFLDLQEQLRDIEEKLGYARQFYNDIVTKYNTKIQMFPTSIIAGIFGFTEEKLFEVQNQEIRENVKVDFTDK